MKETITNYQPIDCSLYDYFESACVNQYQVQLVLDDGTLIVGQATDLKQNKNTGEFLILTDSVQEHAVRLDTIKSIQALGEHVAWDKIDLKDHS